jgi:hypothetical protein
MKLVINNTEILSGAGSVLQVLLGFPADHASGISFIPE